jgi:hypothetical protein
MACYHLTAKPIGRNQGRSAVGASAYRAGERLHNKYDGLTHDYTNKHGVVYSEIMLPKNAPKEYSDRQILWNAVEFSENRKDAQTAREIEIALPNELNRAEQIKLVREYVRDNFLSENMCADIAIHGGRHYHRTDKNEQAKHDSIITPDNPHAHIMLTLRPIDKKGNFANKNRQWNKKEYLLSWRKNWANIQNREFERKGLEVRVSHESYADRGIDREPTIHLGNEAHAMEKRGIKTDRGDTNRNIVERNRAKDERERQRHAEQEASRKLSQERERKRAEEHAKQKQRQEKRKYRDNVQFDNEGARKLLAFSQSSNATGRNKGKKHVENIKKQAEFEKRAEETRQEREEQQNRRRLEHEQRQAERERKRAEEREQNRNRERDPDRDSPSRSR